MVTKPNLFFRYVLLCFLEVIAFIAIVIYVSIMKFWHMGERIFQSAKS